MPAPTYTVPTNNSDTATEEPKVTIALSDLKTLLTGNLDDDNVATAGFSYSKLALTGQIRNADVKSNAALALSKFAAGTSGQIIVCNGSGVPTYVTPSGDITISTAGAVLFDPAIKFAVQTADSPTNGNIPGLAATSLAAGTWWFECRIDVDTTGAGGASGLVQFQFEKNGVQQGTVFKASNTAANDCSTAVGFCQTPATGTEAMRVTLSSTSLLNGTTTRGVLRGIRVG